MLYLSIPCLTDINIKSQCIIQLQPRESPQGSLSSISTTQFVQNTTLLLGWNILFWRKITCLEYFHFEFGLKSSFFCTLGRWRNMLNTLPWLNASSTQPSPLPWSGWCPSLSCCSWSPSSWTPPWPPSCQTSLRNL